MKKVKLLKNKKGFTLIEIIVVLVILAIMAAALIPTMMGYVGDARQKTQLATARAYYVAAQAVATEQKGLNDTIVQDNFDTTKTPDGDRWEELTKDLPGKGAVPASTNPGVQVKISGTGSAAVLEKIRYTYASGKNVHLVIGTGGALTITYDDVTTW